MAKLRIQKGMRTPRQRQVKGGKGGELLLRLIRSSKSNHPGGKYEKLAGWAPTNGLYNSRSSSLNPYARVGKLLGQRWEDGQGAG